MTQTIRDYAEDDRAQVNALALAAFAQYAHDYDDWPAFSAGLARMADLAGDGDLLVAACDGIIAGAVVHVGPGQPRNSAIYADDWSVLRMPVVALHTSPIMAAALRMYVAIGFVRERALAPIRGVPYALYLLPAARIPQALALL